MRGIVSKILFVVSAINPFAMAGCSVSTEKEGGEKREGAIPPLAPPTPDESKIPDTSAGRFNDRCFPQRIGEDPLTYTIRFSGSGASCSYFRLDRPKLCREGDCLKGFLLSDKEGAYPFRIPLAFDSTAQGSGLAAIRNKQRIETYHPLLEGLLYADCSFDFRISSFDKIPLYSSTDAGAALMCRAGPGYGNEVLHSAEPPLCGSVSKPAIPASVGVSWSEATKEGSGPACAAPTRGPHVSFGIWRTPSKSPPRDAGPSDSGPADSGVSDTAGGGG